MHCTIKLIGVPFILFGSWGVPKTVLRGPVRCQAEYWHEFTSMCVRLDHHCKYWRLAIYYCMYLFFNVKGMCY